MTKNVLCHQCQKWEIDSAADDRFCSWCGAALYLLEYTISPDLVYLYSDAVKMPSVTLTVHNHGAMPLQLYGFTTHPAGCLQFPDLRRLSEKEAYSFSADDCETMASGEHRDFIGTFSHAALLKLTERQTSVKPAPSRPHPQRHEPAPSKSVQVRDQGSSSYDSANGSLAEEHRFTFNLIYSSKVENPGRTMVVMRLPEFQLLTPRVEVYEHLSLHQDKTIKTAPKVRLQITHGNARVLRLFCDEPGVALRPRVQLHDGLELRAGSDSATLEFSLEVDRSLVEQQLATGKHLHASLKLECQEPVGVFTPLNPTLQIRALREPRLQFPDLHNDLKEDHPCVHTWALLGRQRPFPFRVQNDGDEVIEITAIASSRSLECLQLQEAILPLRLEPKQKHTINFVMDTRLEQSDRVLQGEVIFSHRLQSGLGYTTSFGLEIQCSHPTTYHGMAAVDFGAAQSCLAVMVQPATESTEMRILALGGGNFLPSTIPWQASQSESVLNAAPMLHIGDLIPHLGTGRRMPCGDAEGRVTLKPVDELIERFLRRLIEIAENRIAAQNFQASKHVEQSHDFGACSLRKIFVTYPATFSDMQIQALQTIFHNLGINRGADQYFQPAPVAAAFYELPELLRTFVRSRETVPNQPDSFFELVYDMGKSLTQLALLQFDLFPESGQRLAESKTVRMQSRLLALNGDDRFGGDGMTAALTRDLAAQAEAHFREKLQVEVAVPLWNSTAGLPRLELEKKGNHNWYALHEAAEATKCRLSELPSELKVQLPPVQLFAMVNDELQSMTADNLVASGQMVENLIERRLVLHVEHIRQLLHKAGITRPHVVRVAGQGALLPFIMRRLQSSFGKSSLVTYMGSGFKTQFTRHAILPITAVKACAAIGGLEFVNQRRQRGYIDLDNHATSYFPWRVGIVLQKAKRPTILPVVEKGVTLPSEWPVPPFKLKRDSRVMVTADQQTNFHERSRTRIIRSCDLDEFKPALPTDLQDEELQEVIRAGRLRFVLTTTYEVTLMLQLRGREHCLTMTLP